MLTIRLLILICILSISNSVTGQPVTSPVSYSYLEDKNGKLDFDVVTTMDFTPIDFNELSFGISTSAYWILIVANVDKLHSWLLESCYTQLDSLDAYIYDGTEYKTILTGDSRPFSSRDIAHPCFVFNLPNIKQQKIYLRIASQGALNIPAKMINTVSFWEKDISSQLLYGLLYAILLLVIMHNLFLYILFRQRVHLSYIGYYTGILIFLSSLSGHTFMYLWPNNTFLANNAVLLSIALGVCCGAQFVKYFCYDDAFLVQNHKLKRRLI